MSQVPGATALSPAATATSSPSRPVHSAKGECVVQGVVFRRSIRASYASIDIVEITPTEREEKTPDDAQQQHVTIIIQFSPDNQEKECIKSNASATRTLIRRSCKIGDLVQIRGGRWIGTCNATEGRRRLEAYYEPSSTNCLNPMFQVLQTLYWNTAACQSARATYICSMRNDTKVDKHSGDTVGGGTQQKDGTKRVLSNKNDGDDAGRRSHGAGICKRQQGEILAEFLIKVIARKQMGMDQASMKDNTSPDDAHDKVVSICGWEISQEQRIAAINLLNSGSGVVDAAGGSGHVSMALALAGVKSTVVDPRESVGRLPGRDRKLFRKTVEKRKNPAELENDPKRPKSLLLPPPIPFSSMRAWFVSKPDGVDSVFREGEHPQTMNGTDILCQNEPPIGINSTVVPICSLCSEDKLLPTCSAIVALHPDEATGAIVDFAVANGIPFVAIPCCVFSRLFPERMQNGSTVSTYDDLIKFLTSKHAGIHKEKLPFDGANHALWATF